MTSRPESCGAHALAYSVAPGVQGGLGHHAAQVLDACRESLVSLTAFGPAPDASLHRGVTIAAPPQFSPDWKRRYTWRRYLHGAGQMEADQCFGRWLAERCGPGFTSLYVFTQIALEALSTLRDRGTAHILDNPNGHIRDFHDAIQREAGLWLSTPYPGHPTLRMVERVEAEYSQANRIRVASSWAADSMAARGVDRSRIDVVPHAVDLQRFIPASRADRNDGTLRIVFVGSLSLGKGFQYLLGAVRMLHTRRIAVRIVGATGDPWCRRLFTRLAAGLNVSVEPGDPCAAYRDADVLVLPTLHDGFGFVVAEAMASGVPVITTEKCGAAEWLEHGTTGWVVPAGDASILASAIEEAALLGPRLREMGSAGRSRVETFAGADTRRALVQLVRRHLSTASPVNGVPELVV